MIFRLRDYIQYPFAIHRAHDRLSASQYWAPERRRGWVQERLERTLRHAVRHVPWYRRTLAPFESRFPEMIDRLDLGELPVLTKEVIRNHYHELIADDHRRYRPTVTHTSGSTGTPTQFMLDAESNIAQFAALWRVLNWAGYRFAQPFADMTAYVPRGGGQFERDFRLNCLHLSTFNFKKEDVPEYVRRLRRFEPVLLKAFPSAAHIFARWLLELGIRDYRAPALLTCGETLLGHQKALFQEVLGCPLYDFYNQNERGVLISTCDRGTYHVHEEYSFAEFVPDPAGDAQWIVGTTFHNLAMPLIRYWTDDLADLGEPVACACGRSYRSIRQIVGRIEDVVVTPDGRHVGRLSSAFVYASGIRLSQIVQNSVDAIEIRIVRGPTFSQNDIDSLDHEIHTRLGDRITVRYTFVDDIPRGKNGKVKFMVSNLDGSGGPGRAV